MSTHLRFAAACGVMFTVLSACSAFAQSNPIGLVYRPVAPCRAFAMGFATSQERELVITGSTGFPDQGGPAGGCGVPAHATAVALSLTTSSSTGTGHLRAYAKGASIPSTQALSFRAGASETASQIVALKDGRLNLKAFTAGTVVAGDVTGYFTPMIQAQIASNGTNDSAKPSIASGSGRITFVLRVGTGHYFLNVDENVYYCAINVSGEDGATIANAYGNLATNTIDVFTRTVSNGSLVPANRSFNISVHC